MNLIFWLTFGGMIWAGYCLFLMYCTSNPTWRKIVDNG